MKRYFVISILAIFIISALVILHEFKRKSMPSRPPSINIEYNGNKIETAKGEYNWFNKEEGGNTCFADIPENLVKNFKNVSVKNGDSIKYTFETSWKQPSKVNVWLVQPNEINKLNFGLKEQEVSGNSFIIPNERGEHIFLITGYWDETHSVDHVFKLNIE